jgi:gas vesicle protein
VLFGAELGLLKKRHSPNYKPIFTLMNTINRHKKITIPVVALLVLGVLSVYIPGESKLHEYLQANMANSLKVFAAVKTMDVLVSAAQGTEISVAPVGVGVTLAVGEALEPLDDLIERVSWVLLASIIALGLQILSLELLQHGVIQYLFLLGFITSAWFAHTAGKQSKHIPGLVSAGILFMILLRFSIPASAGIGLLLNNTMQYKMQSSYEQLQNTQTKLQLFEELQNKSQANLQLPAGQKQSIMEQTKDLWEDVKNKLDVKKHINNLLAAAEQATYELIRLGVLFIFQNILLPILSLWLVYRSVHSLLNTSQFRIKGE